MINVEIEIEAHKSLTISKKIVPNMNSTATQESYEVKHEIPKH
jgi:hypothetical protein